MTLCPGRETAVAAFPAAKLNDGHSMAGPGKENSGRCCAACATDTTSNAQEALRES